MDHGFRAASTMRSTMPLDGSFPAVAALFGLIVHAAGCGGHAPVSTSTAARHDPPAGAQSRPSVPTSAGSAPRYGPPPGPPQLESAEPIPWSLTSTGLCPRPNTERSVRACPTQTCGNGRIEPGCAQLVPPSARGAAPLGPTDEQCDGAALGGASCASLGYAGGRLRCSRVCTFDTTGCSACARSPLVTACGRADIQASSESLFTPNPPSFPFALAATEREVALGWLSGWVDEQGGRVAHFARFRPDLTKIGESSCAGETQLGVVGAGAAVSLLARPGGWLFAATGATGTTVRGLSPDGHPQAQWTHHFRIAPASFVPAPQGRTLMLWPEAYEGNHLADWNAHRDRPQGGHPFVPPPFRPWGVAMMLLGADGTIVGGPVWGAGATLPRAVATGDGFVIAGSMNYSDSAGQPAGSGLGVVAIDAATLGVSARRIVGRSAQTPELLWTGRELVLVYGDTGAIRLQRLRPDGTPLAPPVSAALGTDMLAAGARAVAIEAESLLLLYAGARADADQRVDLYTARVRTDGQLERGPSRVSHDPYLGAESDYQLVRCGTAAIAAWSRRYPQHAIDLARITP